MDFSRPESFDQTDSHAPGGEPAGANCATTAPPPLALRLVSARLRLAAASGNPPETWSHALAELTAAVDLEVERETPVQALPRHLPRPQALRQMAKWAGARRSQGSAPVFEPWQIRSPADLTDPARADALPRARWMASYLHDTGAGRPAARRSVDVMLVSPHPDVCRIDEDSSAALPGLETIRTMIAAIRAEGRGRLAIVTHEHARNAMAQRLLAADAALARDGLELEVCSIEEAIAQPPDRMLERDAVIVLPQLRSYVFALLVRASGVTAPWPMVWHDRAQRRVSGEALDRSPAALDATLLIQSLALAAREAGAMHAAQRVHKAWAELRERGLVTPARGSAAPYTSEVGEADLIDLVCKAARRGHGESNRAAPNWRALCGGPASLPQGAPRRARAALSLVTSR